MTDFTPTLEAKETLHANIALVMSQITEATVSGEQLIIDDITLIFGADQNLEIAKAINDLSETLVRFRRISYPTEAKIAESVHCSELMKDYDVLVDKMLSIFIDGFGVNELIALSNSPDLIKLNIFKFAHAILFAEFMNSKSTKKQEGESK